MNNCVFKGRLVSDPELRQTVSNISFVRFTIAIDKFVKEGEKQADFIRCNAWRGTAEFISRYFVKGQEILIRGELHNNDYEDSSGIKHFSYEVTADRAEFCGSKNNNVPVSSTVAQQNTADIAAQIGDLGDFEEILSDGDVPF